MAPSRPLFPSLDYSALEREQVGRLQAVRAARDANAVRDALAALTTEAAAYTHEGSVPRAHLMPLIIDAVRQRAALAKSATS